MIVGLPGASGYQISASTSRLVRLRSINSSGLAAVALDHLLGQAAPPLWSPHRSCIAFALLEHLRNQLFAAAIAIDIGGVDEVHACVQRGAQRSAFVHAVVNIAQPHEPPIAHAPKLISETRMPVRPKSRYFILKSFRRFLRDEDSLTLRCL